MSHQHRGQCKEDDKPVLVLIRYGCSLTQTARNSLSKNNPLHGNYCGRVIGMGDNVSVLEGSTWPRHKSICVLYFECMCEAQMWYNCTSEIKQHDWLGSVDMIAVPLLRKWDDEKRFLEVMDIKVSDAGKFDGDYVPKARGHLEKTDGNIGTVAGEEVHQLRGNWVPRYIVINQFDCERTFREAYDHEDYKPIKHIRKEAADSDVVTCQLDSLWRNKRA